MNKPIVMLHGFLGEPSDFDVLGLDADAPKISEWSISSLADWADGFNRAIKPNILLGYSMGGRLALHSLIQRPIAKAAIIIAAHPGLKDETHKQARLKEDQKWAQRFKSDPWPLLIDAWNDQAIFENSYPVTRKEKNFSRAELSAYLENFSLGRQDDLLPQINSLPMPILWLAPAGEKEKLAGLELKNPLSQVKFIEGGHRFIFDQPLMVAQLIKEFLRMLFRKHLIKRGQDEQG